MRNGFSNKLILLLVIPASLLAVWLGWPRDGAPRDLDTPATSRSGRDAADAAPAAATQPGARTTDEGDAPARRALPRDSETRATDRFALAGRVRATAGIAFTPGEVWAFEDTASAALRQELGDSGLFGLMTLGRGADADGGREKELEGLMPRMLRERDLRVEHVARLESDGTFRFAALPFRRAQLWLHHPHLTLDEMRAVDTTASARIELLPRVAGAVRGQLVDATGRTVAAAEVDAMREFNPMEFATSGTRRRNLMSIVTQLRPRLARARADGTFELWGLQPGSTEIIARQPPLAPARALTTIVAAQTVDLVLTLHAGASLAVTVVDAEEHPVAGARLRLTSTTQRPHVGPDVDTFERDHETDVAGQARIAGLPVDTFTVRCRVPGHPDANAQVTTTLDEERALRVVLRDGLTQAGTVVDHRGQPVAGARVARSDIPDVKVPFLGGDIGALAGEDLPLLVLRDRKRSVETGADGRFVLRGLEAESIQVLAHKPGHAPARLRIEKPGAAPVTLTLGPVGAVRGRVVTAGTGAPMTAFEARVNTTSFMVIEHALRRADFSSADGAFHIDDLRPGSFTLEIRAPGHAAATAPITIVGDAETDVGEIELAVSARVTGIVAAADGRPVEGATVRRKRGGMMDQAGLDFLVGGEQVTTDEQGRFALENLPPRPVQIEASHEDYTTTTSERIEPRPGQTTGPVRIVFQAGATLTGELRVQEPRSVTEWFVSAQCQRPVHQAIATPDAQGRFRLEHLPAGVYAIEATHMKLAGLDQHDEPSKEQMAGLMSAIQEAMRHKVRAQVRLENGATQSVTLTEEVDEDADTLCTWTGAVRSQGRAVAQAMVVIAPLGAEGRGDMAIADAAGRFTLDRLRPGRHRVTVKRGLFGGGLEHEREIDVPDGRTLARDIDLPGGAVTGRVVTQRDGQGLPGIWVHLADAARDDDQVDPNNPSAHLAMSGTDGGFSFEGLPAGTYRLAALDLFTGKAGSAHRDGIQVADGQTVAGVLLTMTPGATLDVTVLDGAGQPVPGSEVAVRDERGRTLAVALPALSDERGHAAFGNLPPGTYRATARGGGLAQAVSAPLAVEADGKAACTLRLPDGPQVEIVLRGADGKPLAGARVTLEDPHGQRWSMPVAALVGPVGADGVYPVGRCVPGRYKLTVEHRTLGTRTFEQTILAGPTARLTIQL